MRTLYLEGARYTLAPDETIEEAIHHLVTVGVEWDDHEIEDE